MGDFDDDLRQRLSGAAEELERSGLARTAPTAVDRAVRRHRRAVTAQAATAAFAAVLAVAVGVRVLDAPAAREATLAAEDSPSPSTEPVVTESPSPSPSPTAIPSATRPATPVTKPPATASAVAPVPSSSPPASTAPAPVACPPPSVTATTVPNGVRVTLELADGSGAASGSLRMTLVVRNEGTQPVEYTTSGYAYDLWVTDGSAGRWTWSTGKAFTAHLHRTTLKPGEEIRRTETWHRTGCASSDGRDGAPLPAGSYTAHGIWVSDAETSRGWRSAPVQFEID